MKLSKLIYGITIFRSRNIITNSYGKGFYKRFKIISKKYLMEAIAGLPDIGDSIFAFNYSFFPAYYSWYKAYMELGLESDAANQMIWKMNEALVKMIPGFLMNMSKKRYLGTFRKKAQKHEILSNENKVHDFDWKIRFRDISKDIFEIDIYECAMIKAGRKYNVMELFPSMCRMDYLFSHYMKNGFERTKTLGDNDDCCNCRYIMNGSCEWAPQKGFVNRK